MTFPFYLGLGEPADLDERYLEWTVEQSQLMGRLGYGVFFTEHHFRGPWHSNPMEFAAYLIPQLPRDTWLGFAVICVPYYHPVRLVESMNLLDQLAHGRVLFGIGKGFPGGEPAAMGYSTEYAEGSKAFEDSVHVLEQLWQWKDGDPPWSFDTGLHKGTISRRMIPAPYRKKQPNLIVGAFREESVLRAASMGRPVFVGTIGSLDAVAQRLAAYESALADAGHAADVVRHCAEWCSYDWTAVVVADTDSEAEEAFEMAKEERLRFRKTYFEYQEQMFLRHAKSDDGSELRDAAAAGPEMKSPVVGSVESIAARVREVESLGISHLLLRFMGEWNGETRSVAENSLRLFAEQVMPRFR